VSPPQDTRRSRDIAAPRPTSGAVAGRAAVALINVASQPQANERSAGGFPFAAIVGSWWNPAAESMPVGLWSAGGSLWSV
jgi:hypothetical protein